MFRSERADASVVGTALLIVVVALAVVVGAAGIGFLDALDDPPPAATYEYEFQPDGGLTITHTGGQPVDLDRVAVRGVDPDGYVAFGPWQESGTLTAGRSITIAGVSGNEEIRLVWDTGSHSHVLARWVGPTFVDRASGGGSQPPDAGPPATPTEGPDPPPNETPTEGPSTPEPSPEEPPAQEVDPGHAYIDRDGTGTFDPARDEYVDAAELRTGYTTDDQLVVPASVGTITARDGARFEANGIVFGATLVVTADGALEGARFDARNRDLVLDGATIDSRRDQGQVVLESSRTVRASGSTIRGNGEVRIRGGEGVDLRDATVTGTKDNARLTITGDGPGGVQATRATVTTEGRIDVVGPAGVDLRDATVAANKRDAPIAVSATAGNVDLTRALLDANGANPGPGNGLSATVGSSGRVTVTDGVFRSAGNELVVSPVGAATGTPAFGTVRS